MTPGESHNEWYQYYCSNICPFKQFKIFGVVLLTLGVHFEIIHKSIDYQLTFHNASLDICVNPNIAKCNIRLT